MTTMEYPALSSLQRKILDYLASHPGWSTRQDMYAFTGYQRGYAKALGAPTREIKAGTLEALGFVERRGVSRFEYQITDAGCRARGGVPYRSAPTAVPGSVDVSSIDLSDAELERLLERGELRFPEAIETGETLATKRQRRGQDALRRVVLRAYEHRCAVCELADSALLRASHIVRWADRVDTRGDPANVICLCAFHDVLFEAGYWTLSDDFTPIRRRTLRGATVSSLLPVGMRFRLPIAHVPRVEYVRLHRRRHGEA